MNANKPDPLGRRMSGIPDGSERGLSGIPDTAIRPLGLGLLQCAEVLVGAWRPWLVVACAFACARPVHSERLADAPVPMPAITAEDSEAVARGAHLYRVAACVGCHSPPFDDAQHLGGGRDLPVIFGTFYAPNISPDEQHGIGTWTEADFVRAMRRGRAPDGRRYWPTFPYMTYTQLSDEDLSDLWAYLQAQPPVSVPDRPHTVYAPYGAPGLLGMWRRLSFRRGALEPDPAQSGAWNRGRYLVRAVSYCDQCHTPRSSLGLVKKRHDLAGGANPGKADVHPNLTPDPRVGLGAWSASDIADYLATGRKPDGSETPADNIMAEKIHDSFSYYSEDDRRAIAVYLQSLEPDDFDPEQWGLVRRAARKRAKREERSGETTSP